MSTTANPFSALSNPQDSDDDFDQDQKKNKGPRNRQKKGKKYEEERAANKTSAPTEHKPISKTIPTGGKHPLDRHSGTGRPAYGGKDKKQGAGRGNTGRPIDDLKVRETGEIENIHDKPEDEGEGEEESKVEATNTLTLDELKARQNKQAENRVNDKKAKISKEQLLKEALDDKAQVLDSRPTQQIDERIAGKKKHGKTDDDHRIGDTNAGYGQYLNFSTGFREMEYKEKPARDEKGGDRKGPKAPRKRDGEDQKTDEAKPEGESQPVEGGAQENQGADQKTNEGGDAQEGGEKRGYKGGNRGEGGYKGGYKGGDRKGDGYKGDGYKGGYKGGDRKGDGYKGDGYKGDGYKGGNRGDNNNYKGGNNNYKGGNRGGKGSAPQISNDDFPTLQ